MLWRDAPEDSRWRNVVLFLWIGLVLLLLLGRCDAGRQLVLKESIHAGSRRIWSGGLHRRRRRDSPPRRPTAPGIAAPSLGGYHAEATGGCGQVGVWSSDCVLYPLQLSWVLCVFLVFGNVYVWSGNFSEVRAIIICYLLHFSFCSHICFMNVIILAGYSTQKMWHCTFLERCTLTIRPKFWHPRYIQLSLIPFIKLIWGRIFAVLNRTVFNFFLENL